MKTHKKRWINKKNINTQKKTLDKQKKYKHKKNGNDIGLVP